jgi:hypothetical protein
MLAGSAFPTVVFASGGAFLVGCRKEASTSTAEAMGAAVASSTARDPSAGDASVSNTQDAPDEQGADPHIVGAARRDGGGTLDPACEGPQLSLLAAVVDPRCAISEREWSALVRAFDEVDGGGRSGAAAGSARASTKAKGEAKGEGSDESKRASALRQEARREGERIVVSIVNGGTTPRIVPLRYHPGHPELAFSVLAESDGRALFELAPPAHDGTLVSGMRGTVDGGRRDGVASVSKASDARTGRRGRWDTLAELDAGASFMRVHSACIRLPPGGRASATLVIDPHIVKRLDRRCPDPASVETAVVPDASTKSGNGAAVDACLPARLPSGHVVLHVGQLVSGIDFGAPERVDWDVP